MPTAVSTKNPAKSVLASTATALLLQPLLRCCCHLCAAAAAASAALPLPPPRCPAAATATASAANSTAAAALLLPVDRERNDVVEIQQQLAADRPCLSSDGGGIIRQRRRGRRGNAARRDDGIVGSIDGSSRFVEMAVMAMVVAFTFHRRTQAHVDGWVWFWSCGLEMRRLLFTGGVPPQSLGRPKCIPKNPLTTKLVTTNFV